VLIDIHGTDTAELRMVPADDAARPAAVVFTRRNGVRVHADHLADRWVLRTNEGEPNFRLVEAPEKNPDRRDTWRELVPARADATLEGFGLFEDAIAVEERVQARRRVRVLGLNGKDLRIVDGGEAASVSLGDNRDPAPPTCRWTVQSMVRPPATLDVHLASGREILRRQDVVRGLDPAQYRSQLVWAPARDGAKVPVTLAWRADRARRDGTRAAAAGSLRRLWGPLRTRIHRPPAVAAGPRLRGRHRACARRRRTGPGLVRGRAADEQAPQLRGLHRRHRPPGGRTLGARRTRSSRRAASAGGLLMGVVANEAGGRYRGLALDVPFVDVLTTMLDASIPLTANEWGQWGDPREKAAYDYLLSYSPYDNIAARDYPAMLVTTALWDSRVQFHEPAKYVARLRATKTDRNPVLLHVEMNAGHAGPPAASSARATGRGSTPSSWTWPAWLRCPPSRWLSPPAVDDINVRSIKPDPLILHVPTVRSPPAEPAAAAAETGGTDPARRRRGGRAHRLQLCPGVPAGRQGRGRATAPRPSGRREAPPHAAVPRPVGTGQLCARGQPAVPPAEAGHAGPFTFILEATKEVPRRVSHPSRRTIGLRVPDHKALQELLAVYGQPLLGTTLIPPGETEPLNDAQEIRDRFQKQVQAIVDAGACPMAPTTVIDLSGPEPVLMRQGRGDPAMLGL
jgi:hypothetical protein